MPIEWVYPKLNPFKDAIGDRLDHPERVPAEYQHLIPDDKARVEWILSHPLQGHVLEVGCSDGAITRRLEHKWKDADIQGIDVPWHDIRYAVSVEPYDTVFCCEVLEHLTVEDAVLALGNMYALLKPGGQLIITVPNKECADHYTAGCRDRWRWPDHRSVWTDFSLRSFVNRSGAYHTRQTYGLYPPEDPKDSIWVLLKAVK